MILISVPGCLQMKSPDPLTTLLTIQSPTTSYQIGEFKGCFVSTNNNQGRFSLCLELPPADCNLSFLTNIKDADILQKRNDDLTFININLPNCSPEAAPLFAKYNALTPPASILFKDYLNINGPLREEDFVFTNISSCSNSGFLAEPYTDPGFVRLLTRDELISLNSVEVELALRTETTNNCLVDINFQPSFLPILNGLKEFSLSRATVCSYQDNPGFARCQN
jgi:hypothetical protein